MKFNFSSDDIITNLYVVKLEIYNNKKKLYSTSKKRFWKNIIEIIAKFNIYHNIWNFITVC